jgi:NADH-quinone oxidoreductase subunit M
MPTVLICLIAVPLVTAAFIALAGLVGPRPEEDAAPESDHLGPDQPPEGHGVRLLALAGTVITLVLAAVLAFHYATTPELQQRSAAGGFEPQLVPGASPNNPHATTWNVLTLGGWGGSRAPAIQFYLGIDGLNVWLVLLTAVLMVPSVLVSWNAIRERVPEFYAWLLLLQAAVTGVFLSFDLALFYVFFELTLVPLFFLVGIWGGPQRQYAAYKFFIYTLAGSLFTLLGVLGIALTLAQDGPDRRLTFSIPELVRTADRHGRQLDADLEAAFAAHKKAMERDDFDRTKAAVDEALRRHNSWKFVQLWVFLAMMAGFAIKIPLVPLHTWLPLAHVEAPTAGSVLLAGILLKVGAYGVLRLCLPLVPDACLSVGTPFLGWLAVVGIIYGSFCALGQHDIKRLVAYSSVSHMGYCVLGMFALNSVGISGGLMQMINHGLSTGAMFLLVGMLYERYHTRKMADYGGMGKRLHLLACLWVFITLTSIGLPGLNGFVSEMLVMMGIYDFVGGEVNGKLLASVAAAGVVLGAWYMLTLVMRVFFGPLREPPHHGQMPVSDLNGRELTALVPIVVLCLALGVYPRPFLDTVRPDVQVIADIAARAKERGR